MGEGRKEKASLCLWCPDCGESVSAPSLHPHLEEHTKRNSNDSNCQAVAGRASRPARNICFWCPDCEESVSAPSLQCHLQEHISAIAMTATAKSWLGEHQDKIFG